MALMRIFEVKRVNFEIINISDLLERKGSTRNKQLVIIAKRCWDSFMSRKVDVYCRISNREVKRQYRLGLETFSGCNQMATTSSSVLTNLKRIGIRSYEPVCSKDISSSSIAHGMATKSIN